LNEQRTSHRKFDAQLRQPTEAGKRADRLWFLVGALGAAWITVLIGMQSFRSWWALLLFVPVWAMTAYLVLPRLHRMLSDLYVPNYFFGRTRTADGLLGDPVNLGVDGSAAQLDAVMTAAGWHRADEITLKSTWGIIASTLSRRSYPTAPVSPLMLFGRRHDVAYQQEVDGNPKQRHHVRFWHCPPGWLLPGGAKTDWLGAGTFDTDVGLSLFTLQVTHRIDENTDEERDYVVSSVLGAAPQASVRVLKDFTTGYHARNGGGDAFITDGDLPILELAAVSADEHALDDAREIRPQSAEQVLSRAPLSTVGAVLVLAVGAIVDLVNFIFTLTQADVAELGERDAALALVVVKVIGTILTVAQLVACWFVLRGGRRSRILLMCLLLSGIVGAALAYLDGTAQLALNGALLSASFMALALLLLSSESAGAWSRTARRARA
jgi:hypothetical protein